MSWDNKPLHLTDVPAIRDKKTGKVWVRPADVAVSEIAELAHQRGLEPRDIATLLTLKAQAGGFFTKEEVQFQYHINKMLFYQWKELEKIGLGEAFPHDNFVKADRGPMPEHIKEDIQRLEQLGFITTELRKWGPRRTDESRRISLSKKGSQIAESLFGSIPTPILEKTTEVKTRIYPLTPKALRDMVHKEYPTLRNSYTEEDLS